MYDVKKQSQKDDVIFSEPFLIFKYVFRFGLPQKAAKGAFIDVVALLIIPFSIIT